MFIGRLWRSLEHKDIYLKGYADGREAHIGIASWFEFYNTRRSSSGTRPSLANAGLARRYSRKQKVVIGTPRAPPKNGAQLALVYEYGKVASKPSHFSTRDLLLLFDNCLKAAGLVEGWRHEYFEISGINTQRNRI